MRRAATMPRPVRAARGFSLVELMVAVLIGLIGTVVIFQVFAVFEGQKRTATGAGDAQQNGLLALTSLERDARMAGYGINYLPLVGCTVSAYDSTGTRSFTFSLVPVSMTDGASGAPDTVTFAYGTSGMLIQPGKLTLSSAAGVSTSAVDSVYGFLQGDLIIIGNSGASPATNCTMRQITAVPPATATPNTLNHDSGAGATMRYNNPAGLGVAYPAWDQTVMTGGRVFTFGAAPPANPPVTTVPVVGTYSVVSNQLNFQNVITDTAATPIVDGIVQLQAQYGYDTNNDGTIQSGEWQTTAPAVWSRVLAMRIAVLARSPQPEKPDPTTFVCNTTTATPTWSGGNIDPSVTNPTDWQCYRYRVFETQVPVRNLIWFPQ